MLHIACHIALTSYHFLQNKCTTSNKSTSVSTNLINLQNKKSYLGSFDVGKECRQNKESAEKFSETHKQKSETTDGVMTTSQQPNTIV